MSQVFVSTRYFFLRSLPRCRGRSGREADPHARLRDSGESWSGDASADSELYLPCVARDGPAADRASSLLSSASATSLSRRRAVDVDSTYATDGESFATLVLARSCS